MYDYSNGYNYGATSIDAGTAAAAATGVTAFFIIFFTIFLAIIAFMIVAQWKLFKKAGRNGWEAIVPIYNGYVLFEICGYPGWYIFLSFIPFVGSIIVFVFTIMAYISLAKKFGKDEGFGILTIFFPYVCIPILAFGSATYDDSLGEHKNTTSSPVQNPAPAPVSNDATEQKQEASTSSDSKFCSNCGNKLDKNSSFCANCGAKI